MSDIVIISDGAKTAMVKNVLLGCLTSVKWISSCDIVDLRELVGIVLFLIREDELDSQELLGVRSMYHYLKDLDLNGLEVHLSYLRLMLIDKNVIND